MDTNYLIGKTKYKKYKKQYILDTKYSKTMVALNLTLNIYIALLGRYLIF